jgi:hypothetical protein
LQNLVRAGIVHLAEDYTWSGVRYYFSNQQWDIIDAEYVNQGKEYLYFKPVERVIWEFERMRGIKVDRIDAGTSEGKRLRC